MAARTGRRLPSGPVEGGLDQGPATSDPVAVATVDKLVGTTRETALGGVLTGGQPRDKQWNVEIAGEGDDQVWVSMQCSHVTTSVGRPSWAWGEQQRHTAGWLDVENRGWRGIRGRKRHMHHVLQRPALPTRRPRTFGLIGERSESGNDFWVLCITYIGVHNRRGL